MRDASFHARNDGSLLSWLDFTSSCWSAPASGKSLNRPSSIWTPGQVAFNSSIIHPKAISDNRDSSSAYVQLDEPYNAAVVSGERASWAARNDWHLQASIWPGIYSPGACPLFVAAKKGDDFDFDALMQRINALAPPVIADHWSGVSEAGHETFVSPLAITPQDHRRARPKAMAYQMPSKTTVPYGAAAASPSGQSGFPCTRKSVA